MKLFVKRSAAPAVWILFLVIVAVGILTIPNFYVEERINSTKLNDEQERVLLDIAQEKMTLKSKIRRRDDGSVEYPTDDGSYTTEIPNWITNEGKGILTSSELERIGAWQKINSPNWMFWTSDISIGLNNAIHKGIKYGLIIGLAGGLFLLLVYQNHFYLININTYGALSIVSAIVLSIRYNSEFGYLPAIFSVIACLLLYAIMVFLAMSTKIAIYKKVEDDPEEDPEEN